VIDPTGHPIERNAALRVPILALLMLLCMVSGATPTLARGLEGGLIDGGKLLLTNGATTVEGSAGGGLASWAVIPGMETDHGIGLSAFATGLALRDFRLEVHGLSIGLRNRVALSYARENFDTLSAGTALGLGHGYSFGQDIVAARLRLAGDTVYGPAWLPQITVGADFKHSLNGTVVRAVGARQAAGTDFTLSATKLVLGSSVLVATTFRLTKANQFGLLGFGGDRHAGRGVQFEGSLGYQLSRRLVIGGEWRTRPDNLGFARETGAHDLFVAFAPSRHATVTAAFVDIGPVATLRPQRGAYLSLQVAC
jgi:hypothetical protein